MRYIIIILVFLSVGADAQMVIKAHANYRPYAAAAVNLLLDDYPNAAAAYSLRKLDKDYTGNCMRIRRTDNSQESDIGFVNNYLDTTAIKNFTGSGTSAVVVTWFDQSGNGRNASQSVAANQPAIMNANFEFATIDAVATSEKAISFGTSSARLIANFTTISQPISAFAYARKDNVTTAAAGTIYDSYNNTQSILYYTGTSETTNNRWTLASGTALQGTTAGNTNPNLFSTLHNGASSSIHINGQSYVSGNAGTNGLNGLAIGNLRGNPSPIVSGYVLGGRIGELIIYGSDQSSNRTGIENNINEYYNLYWNGDFTGLLDTYGSSAAAYSLRNLSSTYLGPLIRVRRSNDNAEQDIFGDYYGNLDTIGLKAFVGANNGLVVTWYDQSGNSSNATQSTAANQPRIMNAGVIDRVNTKPAVFYDGTNDRFETAIETMDLNSGDNVSGFTVIMPNNITSFRSIITKFDAPTSSANVEDGWGFRITSASKLNIFFGQNTLYSNTTSGPGNETNNTQRLASFFANGGSLTTNPNIFRNGADITDTRTGGISSLDNTTYVVRIGALKYINVFYDHWSGTMQEIVLYNADKRTDRTGIESNINTHYGIY